MKFGLALVLGILIFSAGIHGDLGSILACFIDPGALSEVTGGSTTSGSTTGGISHTNPSPSVKATTTPTATSTQKTVDGHYCPSGYIYNAATKECFVPTHT